LVSTDGVSVRTGTVVAGNATTVHTVSFTNAAPGATLPSTVALTAAGQARGVVETATVNETASGTWSTSGRLRTSPVARRDA
jgi:hypothetical protein